MARQSSEVAPNTVTPTLHSLRNPLPWNVGGTGNLVEVTPTTVTLWSEWLMLPDQREGTVFGWSQVSSGYSEVIKRKLLPCGGLTQRNKLKGHNDLHAGPVELGKDGTVAGTWGPPLGPAIAGGEERSSSCKGMRAAHNMNEPEIGQQAPGEKAAWAWLIPWSSREGNDTVSRPLRFRNCEAVNEWCWGCSVSGHSLPCRRKLVHRKLQKRVSLYLQFDFSNVGTKDNKHTWLS